MTLLDVDFESQTTSEHRCSGSLLEMPIASNKE
jgi:hypothetical protein